MVRLLPGAAQQGQKRSRDADVHRQPLIQGQAIKFGARQLHLKILRRVAFADVVGPQLDPRGRPERVDAADSDAAGEAIMPDQNPSLMRSSEAKAVVGNAISRQRKAIGGTEEGIDKCRGRVAVDTSSGARPVLPD